MFDGSQVVEGEKVRRSPGLARALHATGSPRRGPGHDGYERAAVQREQRRLGAIALALILGALVLAFFYWWERSHATGLTYSHWGALGPSAGDDYDEGAYTISAQLLLKGYALFKPVFSAQPAFFLPSMAAVMRLAGDPVIGAHIYEALGGIAVLIGVFWMAWSAYRPLAGPLAAALLAVSPGFLLYGHAVEAEMPMLGLCTLSVAAAQWYYLRPRRVAAALCGLLLMAGTEMKLLSVVVVVPLALLLGGGLWRGYRAGRSTRALALDVLAFVLCLAVPALLVLALFFPSEQWRQVIAFHLVAGGGSANLSDNLRALRTFLGYDVGLCVLAAAGFAVGALPLAARGVTRLRHTRLGRRSRITPSSDGRATATLAVHASGMAAQAARGRGRYLTLVYALWFLYTLLFLWRYHPLFQHQFVPLLPPLALLGAAASGLAVWPALGTATTSPLSAAAPPLSLTSLRRRPGAIAGVLLALVYLLAFGLRTLPLDRHLLTRPVTPRRAALIALLERTTRPGDFVVCDDPMVALGAHRLLPPGLEDPSRVRTTAGYLTVNEAIAATLHYHVAAIVASRPMFAFYLPGYLAWAAKHYRAVPSPAAGAQVFLRP